MGSCASDNCKKTSINRYDSITMPMSNKIGTIGDNYEYDHEDAFSHCQATVPMTSSPNNTQFVVSNLDGYETSSDEISQITQKNQTTMTNMPIHNEMKVNKYKNSVDYTSGQFTDVLMTNLDENNTQQTRIAVKKIIIGNWTNQTAAKSAENELKILKLCNGHNNIVKLMDSFYEIQYDNLYLHLVMEFIPNTLENVINKYSSNGQCIPFKLIQVYAYQILRALNYINHIKHVIYRNLNPENILIDPITNCVKICDFASAKCAKNDVFSMLDFYVCCRYYRAPELLLKSTNYSYEIDMWSFGCILSELFLGNIMFAGINTMDQMKQIVKTFGFPTKTDCIAMHTYCVYGELLYKFGDVKHGNNYNYDTDWKFMFDGIKDMPQSVTDLIGKILKYNPKERLHPFNAMKHEYFEDLKDNQSVIALRLFDLNDEEINFSKAF